MIGGTIILSNVLRQCNVYSAVKLHPLFPQKMLVLEHSLFNIHLLGGQTLKKGFLVGGKLSKRGVILGQKA